MPANPMTEQIAADPSVLGARRKVFAQLLKFHNMASDPSPLEDPHILAAVDAMDEERTAVIAATQRVMLESAPPRDWRSDQNVRRLRMEAIRVITPDVDALLPMTKQCERELDALCDAIAALRSPVVQESAPIAASSVIEDFRRKMLVEAAVLLRDAARYVPVSTDQVDYRESEQLERRLYSMAAALEGAALPPVEQEPKT